MADIEKRKVLALESIAKSLKTIAAKASGVSPEEDDDDLGVLDADYLRPPVEPMGPNDM